jgi:hypothetical protein
MFPRCHEVSGTLCHPGCLHHVHSPSRIMLWVLFSFFRWESLISEIKQPCHMSHSQWIMVVVSTLSFYFSIFKLSFHSWKICLGFVELVYWVDVHWIFLKKKNPYSSKNWLKDVQLAVRGVLSISIPHWLLAKDAIIMMVGNNNSWHLWMIHC